MLFLKYLTRIQFKYLLPEAFLVGLMAFAIISTSAVSSHPIAAACYVAVGYITLKSLLFWGFILTVYRGLGGQINPFSPYFWNTMNGLAQRMWNPIKHR